MRKTEDLIRPGQGKVIALVHGIGAKGAQEYWQDFLKVLSNDEQLQGFGLFVWKYPTHVELGWWKNFWSTLRRRTLRETAPRIQQLGAAWDTTYRTQFHNYSDVILICHSMGGLVVKSWIIDLLGQGQSQRLDPLRHISFYDTPHNGAPVTTLTNWNEQLKDMQLDSRFIEEVGTRWYDHVVAWKSKAPSSEYQRYNRYIPHLVIAGLADLVVPQTYATIRGMPLTTVDGDHSEVIQPIDDQDTRYRVWRNALEEIIPIPSKIVPSAVLFDEAHGQSRWTWSGMPPKISEGYEGIKKLTEKHNTVEVLKEHITAAKLRKYAAFVLLIGPGKFDDGDKGYSYLEDEELDAIHDFVGQGGGLLVMSYYTGDWHHGANLNDVLKRYGITFNIDVVMPKDATPQQAFAQLHESAPNSKDVVVALPSTDSSATNRIREELLAEVKKVATLSSCSLHLDQAAIAILSSGPESTLFEPLPKGQSRLIAEYKLRESSQAILVGASKNHKVIAVGSWKTFLNEFIDEPGYDNRQLYKNILNWLTSK